MGLTRGTHWGSHPRRVTGECSWHMCCAPGAGRALTTTAGAVCGRCSRYLRSLIEIALSTAAAVAAAPLARRAKRRGLWTPLYSTTVATRSMERRVTRICVPECMAELRADSAGEAIPEETQAKIGR